MDAGGIATGKKVIINIDHVTGIEEKCDGTCVIHLVDGVAIDVNENINDIWHFMLSQQKNPTYIPNKTKTFNPDKKIERSVM